MKIEFRSFPSMRILGLSRGFGAKHYFNLNWHKARYS